MWCSICQISCPSDYQWQQHIRGKKHLAKVGAGGAAAKLPCFTFKQRGYCANGRSCHYAHDQSPSTPSCQHARTGFPDAASPQSMVQSLDMSPTASASAASEACIVAEFHLKRIVADPPVQLPLKYRDALKRKKCVSLFIQHQQVAMQFAYDDVIKEAVKQHIRGRRWDPTVGEKGCWVCPLESLPDAVSLWEHMGRKPDNEILQRAAQIESVVGRGGGGILLKFALSVRNRDSLGSIFVSFQYDTAVVAAMKQVAPIRRSYDPSSRIWTVDLLALPELIEHLRPLGFTPSAELAQVISKCATIERLLFPDTMPVDSKSGSGDANLSPAVDSALVCGSSGLVVARTLGANEGSQERKFKMESEWHQLLTLLRGAVSQQSVDRSDCGQAKKRRVAIESYGGLSDFDDMDIVLPAAFEFLIQPEWGTPIDCDCGFPNRRVGGKHCCRYFGTFHCACGNTWTSAYCWKGEKQACRQCGDESFPAKKELLDGRPPSGGGGPHDTLRCSKCRRLGYDCSSGSSVTQTAWRDWAFQVPEFGG